MKYSQLPLKEGCEGITKDTISVEHFVGKAEQNEDKKWDSIDTVEEGNDVERE